MTKKLIYIIIGGGVVGVAVVAGVLFFLFGNNSASPLLSVQAKNGDITESVTLTGQVTASQEVDLSFDTSGKIVASYVKAGDTVGAGQTIAVLNQNSAIAALTSAKGSLAQAQANYEKLQAGATTQNVQTSEDAVSSAKQNLANAYIGSINTLNTAYTTVYNAYNVAFSIQKNDFSSQDQEGIAVSTALNDINANTQSIKSILTTTNNASPDSSIDQAIATITNSVNSVFSDIGVIRTQCDQGAYYNNVSAADKASLDSQKTILTSSATSVTALQQNIASLKISLQTAQDQLNVTTAPPTQSEIDAAQAQITSAQGQVDSAQAAVDNTVLSAPFSGQINKDNATVGQMASPGVPVATISNNNLQIDTEVSEINLAGVKVGNSANVTLDAFGSSTVFPATVISVDSAPSIVNGISVYNAKLKFNNSNNKIEPGMTANINIISATHTNVLLIPKSAVIQRQGTDFVLVDEGNGAKKMVEVITGLSDDNNIEIISGLSAGQKVLAY